MGGFSIWHWLVVGIVILLLFGKGRFSEMMGDIAKGLKSFKKGMTEDEEAAARGGEAQRRLPETKRVEVNDRPTTVEAPADRPTTLETPADRSRDLDPERREP
ncbi:MAG: twin-arginine translocase TatA/TatE family subunit [Allosphingosinicella sp.]